jgi:hypothetical protein
LNLINIDETGPDVNDDLNRRGLAAVSRVAEVPSQSGRDVVFPVAAAAAVGWVLLFFVLLVVPPREEASPGPAEGVTGAESPAVISLLARRLHQDGFGATLLDLAARGWFQLSEPSGRGGTRKPAAPAMCVVPSEPPGEPLTAYERRVVTHVARRAGAGGEVPAPVLADGFEGGEAGFMNAFRGEVTADAVGRGLTRPRLGGRRIALLCLVLLVPAGALALALARVHQHDPLVISGWCWFGVSVATIGVGVRRRPTAAGQAVLDRWHAAADEARRSEGALLGDARLPAYAAALGRAPGAVAAFAPPGPNTAWSSYRGGWQQIVIETNTNTMSCQASLVILLAIVGAPLLTVFAAIWLGSQGLGAVVGPLTVLAWAFGLAGVVLWLLRRRLFPRFVEFDGQVIRQRMIAGDEDGPDEYHIAVDDGVRAKAWDLTVDSGLYGQLAPGALVHARVRLWRPRQTTVSLVQPPSVARPLADPGVPFDPRAGS